MGIDDLRPRLAEKLAKGKMWDLSQNFPHHQSFFFAVMNSTGNTGKVFIDKLCVLVWHQTRSTACKIDSQPMRRYRRFDQWRALSITYEDNIHLWSFPYLSERFPNEQAQLPALPLLWFDTEIGWRVMF
jgi:hypothetical protein